MPEWRHVTPWHPPILVRIQGCDDNMVILIYTWPHLYTMEGDTFLFFEKGNSRMHVNCQLSVINSNLISPEAVRWTLLQAIQLLIVHWSDTKLYLILIICFQLNIQRQLPSTEAYSNNGSICIFKITDTQLIFFFLNEAEGIFSLSNQHILNMAGE